jgi:hypothetical protein
MGGYNIPGYNSSGGAFEQGPDPNDPNQQQPNGYTQLLARLRQLQTGGLPLQQQQNGQVGMNQPNQPNQPYNKGTQMGSNIGSIIKNVGQMFQPQVGTGGNLPASSMMNIGMPPSLYGGAPAAAPPSFPGDGSSMASPDMPEFAYGGTIFGQNDPNNTSSSSGPTIQGPADSLFGEAGPELLSHSSGAPPEVITKPQVRTLGTQGTDTVTPLTAPPHKVTPAGKNLIKRLHPKYRFDEGGTVTGEDDALYGSDLDAMAAQQRANPQLDAVDESEGAGGPIPAGTANLGASGGINRYGILPGVATLPAAPTQGPTTEDTTNIGAPPLIAPDSQTPSSAANAAAPQAASLGNRPAAPPPSVREQTAGLRTPVPTPPSMGQRVAAGVLGGLAGWANQKAWRGRPIDTTAATQNILYPGQAQKQAQFNAQAQDLQRQLNMQEGGDKDKMQAAQLANLQANTALTQNQVENPSLKYPDLVPDPDPNKQNPKAYPGTHLVVGGQPMYRPTAVEKSQQTWLEVPTVLQKRYGMPAKAPYQMIDSTLRTMEIEAQSQATMAGRQQMQQQVLEARAEANNQMNQTKLLVGGMMGANKTADASNKSYQFNVGELNKIGSPVDQLVSRMGRLQDTLAQNSPAADALVAPELLTVMAGGQGSGMRMNEAEISRIVGGRSNWQSLQAAVNKWQLDPSQALSITPAQRAQMNALIGTVNQKLQAKKQIVDQAQQDLVGTDDIKQHRQIVVNARRSVSGVDQGAGQPSGQVPPAVQQVLSKATPGIHTLSDGSKWMKTADGNVIAAPAQ